MRFLAVVLAFLFCVSANADTLSTPYTPPIARPIAPIILTAFCDSTCQDGAVNVSPGAAFPFASGTNGILGFQATNVEGWLQAFADGILYADPTQGYPGNVNGLGRVIVTTQGACTPSATLTFQPSAPTSTPTNTAASFTLAFDASGHAAVGTDITIGAPGSAATGSGYIFPPTYTVSGGSCATQPVFAYILTGTANYGVAGDRTGLMVYRVKDVCKSTADIVMVSAGVNDLINGVAYATIKTNLATIVAGIQTCGKRVLLEGITPVTVGTSGWTATMDKQRLDINAYERSLCQAAAVGSLYPSLVCADASKYWMDATSATGNPLTTVTSDNVHSAVSGAELQALVDLAAIAPWLGNGKYITQNQQDVYDATNNPFGNQMAVAAALWTGTGGTIGSCATGGGSCTGTLATGWTSDWSGTGAMTGAFSVETPRTDGLSGQRQVVALSDVGGGAADRIRLFATVNKSNFVLGTDQMLGGVNIDVSGITGAVEFIGCELFETPTSGNNQASVSLFGGSTNQAYPMITSAQMARIQEAKLIPDFGLTGAGSFRMNCEMPPYLTQSTASSYTFYIYIIGGGTWGATLKFGNAYQRKNAL